MNGSPLTQQDPEQDKEVERLGLARCVLCGCAELAQYYVVALGTKFVCLQCLIRRTLTTEQRRRFLTEVPQQKLWINTWSTPPGTGGPNDQLSSRQASDNGSVRTPGRPFKCQHKGPPDGGQRLLVRA